MTYERDPDRRDPGSLPGTEGERAGDSDYPPGAGELPRAGAPTDDPYTPEPGPRPGDRRAFRALRWAWIVVLVVAAIIVWAVLSN